MYLKLLTGIPKHQVLDIYESPKPTQGSLQLLSGVTGITVNLGQWPFPDNQGPPMYTAVFELIANLPTKWHYLNQLQIWSPGIRWR